MTRLTRLARSALEQALARRGLCIREIAEPPRGFARFLRLYREYGPTPQTVFDIGVGSGTPWLYEAFPDAYFVLIEPLHDFKPQIDAILQSHRGVCHYCALAETAGELTLHVPIGVATGTSLLQRDPNWAAHMASQGDMEVVERRVPVVTLDSVAGSDVGPHIVKIDVEGAELRVMQGGRDCIRTADMVIVEASITPRYAGENDFVDIAHHLKTVGFRLAEIVEMSTYGQHHMLAYLDAVFIRNDNPFLSRVVGP